MHWPSTGEADWEALYADHLPRIYNYFRLRLAGEADVEEPYTPACDAEKQSG